MGLVISALRLLLPPLSPVIKPVQNRSDHDFTSFLRSSALICGHATEMSQQAFLSNWNLLFLNRDYFSNTEGCCVAFHLRRQLVSTVTNRNGPSLYLSDVIEDERTGTSSGLFIGKNPVSS